MLPQLFASSPPLDEPSIDWIFEVFAWSLRHLDGAFFRDHTVLVTPTNEHFSGRANSVEGMAGLIFQSVAAHAGMAHWPMKLVEPSALEPALPGPIAIDGSLRRTAAASQAAAAGSATLPIPFDPALVTNPEAMIAGLAQNVAHHLGATSQAPLPGGIQNWPQSTEVIGVFLGFGLMFANTAFEFQSRSCGSCGGPRARREAYLSQYDITYALALFATLKDLPERVVLRHLKSSLKGHYKRCVRDIRRRSDALEALRAQIP